MTAFSSFYKRQLTVELRYEPAYLIWDRAGTMWSEIARSFKNFKHTQVSPNLVVFQGDDRFDIAVGLERLAITDLEPHSTEKTAGLCDDIADLVTQFLNIGVLNRVGMRAQHAIKAETLDDAKRMVREFDLIAVPSVSLFSIEPKNVAPVYKIEVDDGEMGYIAQLYAEERKLEFTPKANMKMDPIHQSVCELVLDIDCFTKKSVRLESFNLGKWMSSWQKAINADMNKFLNLASVT